MRALAATRFPALRARASLAVPALRVLGIPPPTPTLAAEALVAADAVVEAGFSQVGYAGEGNQAGALAGITIERAVHKDELTKRSSPSP